MDRRSQSCPEQTSLEAVGDQWRYYALVVVQVRDDDDNDQHIIGHFEDKSFQSITSTGTDNLTRTTKRQNTQITQNNTTPKGGTAQHTNSKKLG